eukprot:352473-Chlamydomonas_euryale.AAC.3
MTRRPALRVRQRRLSAPQPAAAATPTATPRAPRQRRRRTQRHRTAAMAAAAAPHGSAACLARPPQAPRRSWVAPRRRCRRVVAPRCRVEDRQQRGRPQARPAEAVTREVEERSGDEAGNNTRPPKQGADDGYAQDDGGRTGDSRRTYAAQHGSLEAPSPSCAASMGVRSGRDAH